VGSFQGVHVGTFTEPPVKINFMLLNVSGPAGNSPQLVTVYVSSVTSTQLKSLCAEGTVRTTFWPLYVDVTAQLAPLASMTPETVPPAFRPVRKELVQVSP